MTSAIITNPTQNNGWVVEDNLMGGGAYTLYCPEQGTNLMVRDNRFVPPKSAPTVPRTVSPMRATTQVSRGPATTTTPTASPSLRRAINQRRPGSPSRAGPSP